jgi:hypothetical protein
VVMEKHEFRSFLGTFYPNHIDTVIVDLKGESSDDRIADFIQSPEHMRILILANSKSGTDEAEVIRKFGEAALPYFEELKAASVLEKREEAWFFHGDVGHVSLPAARRIFGSMVANCDRRNDDIPSASYVGFGWESLSKGGLERFSKMMKRHDKEMYDFVSDPANQGDVLVIYGMLHNVLKGQEGLV